MTYRNPEPPGPAVEAIFHRCARHLLTQGRRSLSHSGNLAYRGANDTKDPVGLVIANEHYNEGLEGKIAATTHVCNALLASGVPLEGIPVLVNLQGIHDLRNPSDWYGCLQFVASQHGFSWPPPDDTHSEVV